MFSPRKGPWRGRGFQVWNSIEMLQGLGFRPYIAEGCLIRSSCLTEPAGTAAHLQAVFSASVLHFPQHRRDQVLVGCVSPPAPISKFFLLDPSPSSLPISTPRWHLFQYSGILLLKQGSREQHHWHHLGAG